MSGFAATDRPLPFPAGPEMPFPDLHQPSARRPAVLWPGRLVTGLLVLLAVGSGVMNYWYASRLDRLGAFERNDILFMTDPWVNLKAFAEGFVHGRGYKHPNLTNLVNPPIELAARIAERLPIVRIDGTTFRRRLALSITPLLGAIQTILIFLLLGYLGFQPSSALLISAWNTVSLSRVVFFSLPEYMAINGFLITGTFWLAADALRREGRIRKPLWLLWGFLAFGVTITNIVPFAILLLVCQLRTTRAVTATFRTAKLVIVAVGLNLVYFWVMTYWVYGLRFIPLVDLRSDRQHNAYQLRPHNLWRFPLALAHTIAAPAPFRTSIGREVNSDLESAQRIQIGMTYFDGPALSAQDGLLAGATLVFLTLGVVGWRRHRLGSYVLGAGLAVILINCALHLVYGADELFVFSQHWQAALTILLAGCLQWTGRWGNALRVVMGAAVATVALSSTRVMSAILEVLASYAS